MTATENNVAAQAGDPIYQTWDRGSGGWQNTSKSDYDRTGEDDRQIVYRGPELAAQAGDEPLTERDIADLRNVIAVAERGRMPDLAAQAQGMLDSGVLPARAAGKAVQAGDEPMRQALQVCVKTLEFRKERSANDEFALNLARIALAEAPRATADVERDAALYRALHTPEISQFIAGVEREALFQRDKWGADHDAGKAPEDWFWLLGYLGGKALHAAKAGNTDKALHHTISSAAALLNWHAAILGAHTAMRPGIATTKPGA